MDINELQGTNLQLFPENN